MTSTHYDDIPEIEEEPISELRSATAHASFSSVNQLRNKLTNSADERSRLLPSERIVDIDSSDVGGASGGSNTSSKLGNAFAAAYPRSAMIHLMVVCIGMRFVWVVMISNVSNECLKRRFLFQLCIFGTQRHYATVSQRLFRRLRELLRCTDCGMVRRNRANFVPHFQRVMRTRNFVGQLLFS
jgi:hypothetical protein